MDGKSLPEVTVAAQPRAGRPDIWSGRTGRSLVLAVRSGLDAGSSLDAVITGLRSQAPWCKWSHETLCRKYREARRRHGELLQLPPDQQLMQLLTPAEQAWLSLLRQWGKLIPFPNHDDL